VTSSRVGTEEGSKVGSLLGRADEGYHTNRWQSAYEPTLSFLIVSKRKQTVCVMHSILKIKEILPALLSTDVTLIAMNYR